MIVKICGITNRDDALEAAEGGAHALGFNFWPRSPRYIAPEEAAQIIEGLPPAVWKVGVFVNEAPERVVEIARQARLDVAQLHGDEPAEAMPAGLRVWKAFRVRPGFTLARLEGYVAEACLLDAAAGTAYGGSGRTFDWTAARGARQKIILAGGLDAENVRAAIEAARPWGVDACSRLESTPGKKDREKMRRFLQAALEE